jgi:hypothetical protein
MEKVVKRIHLAYYLIYTATILSSMIGYLINMNRTTSVDPKSSVSIALSTIVILYIIISIPTALALFHKNTKKWAAIEDNFTKINKYVTGAIWRIIAVGSGLVLSVVVFYFIQIQSMIYCALIAAVALFFCKPTERKITSDLKLEDDETEE